VLCVGACKRRKRMGEILWRHQRKVLPRSKQLSSYQPTISSCCAFLLATRLCKTRTSRRNASLSARNDSLCLTSCATVFWSSSITTVSRNRLLRADLRFAARRRSFLSSSEAHGPLLRVMVIVLVLKQPSWGATSTRWWEHSATSIWPSRK
jgi:hypothetical protein